MAPKGDSISLWHINWKLMFFLMLPGIGMIVASFLVSPEARTDDGHPLNIFLLVLGGFFIVVDLAVVGVFHLKNQSKKELYLNGISGTAQILSMNETGTRVNDMPVIKMRLLVSDGYGPDREVVHKQIISYLTLRDIHEGDTINVKVHPRKPDKLLLLF